MLMGSAMAASTAPQDPFEEELMAHLDVLYGLALRMAGCRADAEDLVQETFIKAMRARDQYFPNTNFRAWLFKILKNTQLNRLIRLRRERDTVGGPNGALLSWTCVSASSINATRGASALALPLQQEIEHALYELPRDLRLAVLLSDGEGMSYREIAAVMDCPIGTVMSRLHRGRRLLRGKLGQVAAARGIIKSVSGVRPRASSA
jgi:RNA polymerase sigma-70 factor (ECF subfamily)